MNISPIIEQALQIWIVVIAFHDGGGVRHVGQMQLAFTTEEKCEVYAKKVMFDNHKKIPGLYWFCEEVRVDP